jgi:hypothetical protein
MRRKGREKGLWAYPLGPSKKGRGISEVRTMAMFNRLLQRGAVIGLTVAALAVPSVAGASTVPAPTGAMASTAAAPGLAPLNLGSAPCAFTPNNVVDYVYVVCQSPTSLIVLGRDVVIFNVNGYGFAYIFGVLQEGLPGPARP